MYDSYRITKTGSIYIYFIEKGLKLLSNRGVLIFINPYQYINADSGLGIRTHILENHCLSKVVDVSNLKVFDNVSTYTCINLFYNNLPQSNIDIFSPIEVHNLEVNHKIVDRTNISKEDGYKIYLSQNSIIDKVASKGKSLSTYADVLCGLSASGFRDYVTDCKIDDSYSLFTESKQIGYYTTTTQNKYVNQAVYSSTPLKAFRQECIFIARMTSHIRAAISRKNEAAGKVNVVHNFKQINVYYLLGLLNSKLLDYYYGIKNEAKHLNGGAFGFDTASIKELPILINRKYENKIVTIVKQIIVIKKRNPMADISTLQTMLDNLVCKVYDLSEDERKVIEQV